MFDFDIMSRVSDILREILRKIYGKDFALHSVSLSLGMKYLHTFKDTYNDIIYYMTRIVMLRREKYCS